MPFNERGGYRKENHYDRVCAALHGGKWALVQRWIEHGSYYELWDTKNDLKVGQVTFDKQLRFMGGTFYNMVSVKGKTQNAAQALVEFEKIIGKIHVKH